MSLIHEFKSGAFNRWAISSGKEIGLLASLKINSICHTLNLAAALCVAGCLSFDLTEIWVDIPLNLAVLQVDNTRQSVRDHFRFTVVPTTSLITLFGTPEYVLRY